MIASIIASPRPEGFGATLAGIAADAAREAGEEVRTHRLNDMQTIRQCQNCQGCKRTGRCVLHDDVAPIIDDVREADGILLCTSINFNDMDGLFKLVLDRFYCFLDANGNNVLPKGKRVGVIVTAGADENSANRVAGDIERVMTQHFFCESAGKMTYCTWFMLPGMDVDDDTAEKAREIGRKLAGST